MPTVERLADTPRSSPRSQRRKVKTSALLESPAPNLNAGESRKSIERKSQRAIGNSGSGSPEASRKHMKAEAPIVEKQVQAQAEQGSLKKTILRKGIKIEEDEEQNPKAETQGGVETPTETSRDRKVNFEDGKAQINRTTSTSAKRTRSVEVEGAVKAENSEPSPKKIQRKRIAEVEEEAVDSEASPKKAKQKTELKDEEGKGEDSEEGSKKIKRKRKTKEEKEAEAMPLAARTTGLQMFLGAHVSAAKGVHNTVTNCVHIGGNAFAMFLKSQRKWENPPLQDEHKDQFVSGCRDHKYDAASHVLPHGSYLVNLAQEEDEKATQAYNAFVDDLHRCEALGIRLYNFHPGSTGSKPRPSAIARIAGALNRAHKTTHNVIPILETMAGGGNVVGSTFEDLRDIIEQVDDKTRIGVCLDTCHVFAGGYDLRSPATFKRTLDDFDKIVGIKYLRALHLNDSKAPFASHRDLHQNIGLGFLGLRAFHNVMNESRFEGLPMVLETPIDRKDPETGKEIEDKSVWAREIKMLEGLIGVDADGDEFKTLEKELADQGAEERKKLQDVFDRKVEKDRKALEKGQMKLSFGGKKKKQAEEVASDAEI
ncbi:hypothetical protein N7G274_002794 [Stereocaulon virgatum]|uniref:Xylose isomerase-like TIM barrel domain-containing protein n=1 Tax=Stereocaulon virgatum TaxID=373712 RepID=A0ABR4AJZ7_9LECA